MQPLRQTRVNRYEKAFKVASVVAGVFVMLSAGTLYSFSVWAPYLQTQSHLTQIQVNIVGSFGNIGSSLGFFSGLIYDHHGPVPTTLMAASLLFSGYFLVLCAMQNFFGSNVNFGLYALFTFIIGQGSSFAYTTSLSTNIRNFHPKRRGLIVGLLVSFYGLSGALLTVVYKTYFQGHGGVDGFIMTVTIFTASVSLIGGLLQSYPREHPDFDENDSLLAFNKHYSKDERSISGKRLFKSREFWVLAGLMFMGTSTGVLYINVVGSLYLSLGAAPGAQNTSVLLISIMNALGRLSSGLITDRLSHRVKRSVYLGLVYVLMSLNWFFLGSFESLTTLPFCSLVAGFCYGATLCVLPTITSELFGVCTFAENWGCIQPFNSMGGLVLAAVAGANYQHQIQGHTSVCVGHSCYAHTFMLMGLLCVMAFLLCCYLTAISPSVNNTSKHVVFPQEVAEKALFRFHFLHPFHHHHVNQKSAYIVKQEEILKSSLNYERKQSLLENNEGSVYRSLPAQ